MSKSKVALGALAGAAIGVVAGMLTAPKSGKETRADLKEKAQHMKAEAKKRADQTKAAAADTAASLKAGSKRVGEAMSHTAQDVKQDVNKHFTK